MKPPKNPGPSQQEQAQADVASQTWDDYKTRFRPAEKALAKKSEFTAGERAQVKGEVSADTASAFKGINRSTISAGNVGGANVASGKTKLSLAGDAAAAGHAKGVGQSMAETGGKIDSEQQRMKIAGFGRGIAAGAEASLNRGAVRATRLAIASSEAKFRRNMANTMGAATIAGAATRKFGGDNDLIAEIPASPLRSPGRMQSTDFASFVDPMDFSAAQGLA